MTREKELKVLAVAGSLLQEGTLLLHRVAGRGAGQPVSGPSPPSPPPCPPSPPTAGAGLVVELPAAQLGASAPPVAPVGPPAPPAAV